MTPETPCCYRHPDRATGVHCTRCDRPICPDCMRSATVGHQCVECAQPATETTRTARPVIGSGRPVLTYALIGLNVLAFIVQNASADVERHLVLWAPAVADGQMYRLVTSAFLHYGLMHLALNMWALFVVGPALEYVLGRLRFAALYGVSALGGSVLVYLLSPLNTATAGASGAIFGLFGAMFVVAKRMNTDVRWVGAVIVANLVFTLAVPNISWQGHVGGLVTGTVVTLAYMYAPHDRRDLVHVGTTVGVLVVLAGLVWWRTTELTALLGLH